MKMKIMVLLSCALFLSACAPTLVLQPEDLTIADYFPMVANRHQVFAGEGNEYAAFETYVDYLAETKMQERMSNGGTVAISVYHVKEDSLHRVYFAGESYGRWSALENTNQDEILLKTPLEVGTAWKVTLHDSEINRSITALDAEVTTIMGAWKCLEVTSEFEQSVQKDYYAPKIGLVLRTFYSKEAPNNEISSSLVKTEVGLGYETTIRIFYPEFNQQTHYFQEKKVTLKTNEEIYDALETVMKTAPKDTSLTSLFTENVEIISIRREADGSKATIDVSADFVSEMNAGTTLESMLLQGVAATVEYYFQVTAVELLIEGQPYRSGHVEFEPGQTLEVDWGGFLPYTEIQ